MNVLLIGSGGREHALAESLVRSPSVTTLFVAPGNPGTAGMNASLDVSDPAAVVSYCQVNSIGLVVVGPEGPLVAGLADALNAASIRCFGPSSTAARLEGSKSFARDFARRHSIPGPLYKYFDDSTEAIAWLDEVGVPVVVKADGLAAGKGVVVPLDRDETEEAIIRLLAMGSGVVLEERLVGEEISLFAIVSGRSVDPIGKVVAQDHKRLGEGDLGPNTGGMGAFAPVPNLDPGLIDEMIETFLVTAANGMVDEGCPYTGILYAGIMLTASGPRLIEYNCRFGDPEAQVIVPLVTSDLGEVFAAAAAGESWSPVRVLSDTTAATVVVASQGYPSDPVLGTAIPDLPDVAGVRVYHAGTLRNECGQLVASGGRVLSVTGLGHDLAEALGRSYEAVDQILVDGLIARRDIGWRRLPKSDDAYAAAGVNISAGAKSNARIAKSVVSTHDERVVSGLGGFGGVFDLSALKDMEQPLMVSTTDGVGTKTVLAAATDRWEGVGADIVNHGVNDVLVQNAKPLFFLDTVASARLDVEVVGRIVDGMAEACRSAGCVLIGGETAEMPGVLAPGAVDIAGTMVGVVEGSELLPNSSIAPGHLLVGLESSGLHTNGYSLARMVMDSHSLEDAVPEGNGESLADALTAVHINYEPILREALDAGLIDGLAHITGGGLIDNLPRVLPPDCGAAIDAGSWTIPPLFRFLMAEADMDLAAGMRTLNLGVGMVALIAPDRLDEFTSTVTEASFVIGEVVVGEGVEVR